MSNDNVIDFEVGRSYPNEGKSNPNQVDLINSPPHYNQNGVEAVDILEHVAQLYKDHPVLGYHVVTMMKYLLRAPFKHATPLADLNKAKWHCERAISKIS